jgi:hypothetical protein
MTDGLSPASAAQLGFSYGYNVHMNLLARRMCLGLVQNTEPVPENGVMAHGRALAVGVSRNVAFDRRRPLYT